MKTFQEWLSDKQLLEYKSPDPNWQPTPRMNQDTLMSALTKIRQADKKGGMPYSGNFQSIDVIQGKFFLDDEEMQALQNAKLIARNQESGGWNVVPSNQQLASPKMPPPAPNLFGTGKQIRQAPPMRPQAGV